MSATSQAEGTLAVIALEIMHRLIFIIILIHLCSCVETDTSISQDKISIKQLNDTTEVEVKEYTGKLVETYFNYNLNHELKSKTEYVTFNKRILQIDTLPYKWYRNHFFSVYEFRFPDKSCEFDYSFNKEILYGNYTIYCNNIRNRNVYLLESVTQGNGFYNYQVSLIDSIKKDTISVKQVSDRQLPKSVKWNPDSETYLSLENYYKMKDSNSKFNKTFE